MTLLANIKKRAAKARRAAEKARTDPRYARVVGRFMRENALFDPEIWPCQARPTLDECLWVGTHAEPRVLEVLPALLLRRPAAIMFEGQRVPEDLKQIMLDLKRGKATQDFRGIPAAKYAHWVTRFGRKGASPRATVTYRFSSEEIAALDALAAKWDCTPSAAIRKAVALANSKA